MKYGLLYYKDTDNIGDDIQSYAQARFLPRIDYFIDRENIGNFVPDKKEFVATIMNAWYQHDKFSFFFSPYIYPKFISMHFTKLPYDHLLSNSGMNYFDETVISYLKKFGPVGVRDDYTKQLFDDLKIENYFSGCMTLTLEKFPNVKREDYICAVSLNQDEIDRIKKLTNREVKVIDQDVERGTFSNESWDERKKRVEDLLLTYQKAHMVITRKLHCALPCLSLETPVLLLYESRYEDRIGTFREYVNHVNREDFLNCDIDIENPLENPNGYKKLRNKLIKSCEKFIKQAEESNLDIESLPDPSFYKEFSISRQRRIKVVEEFLKSSNQLYIEASAHRDYYHSRLAEVEKELYELKQENDKLKKANENFINNIFYKTSKKVKKTLRIKD